MCEAPASTASASPTGTSAPDDNQNDDHALLALEQEFEVLARKFAKMDMASPRKGKGQGREAGLNQTSSSEASDEFARGDVPVKLAARQLKEIESALARLQPIEQGIMETPAQTLVGLGVKARHAAYIVSEYWAEPLEKTDWDRRAIRLLIESICVLAGRPLAMGEASRRELSSSPPAAAPALPVD